MTRSLAVALVTGCVLIFTLEVGRSAPLALRAVLGPYRDAAAPVGEALAVAGAAPAAVPAPEVPSEDALEQPSETGPRRGTRPRTSRVAAADPVPEYDLDPAPERASGDPDPAYDGIAAR